MRISTAYFAGVGTVIVAVTAGLGGGYLAANITSPPTQAVSKLERRMSAEPITSRRHRRSRCRVWLRRTPRPRRHSRNRCHSRKRRRPRRPPMLLRPPIMSAPKRRPPLKRRPPIMSRQRSPYSRRCNLSNPPNRPKKRSLRLGTPSREPATPTSNARTPKSVGAERRQRWADKRRFQQPREQELEAVEERVREVTEPRRIRIREEGEPREMFAEPARNETPRIRLFDQDN